MKRITKKQGLWTSMVVVIVVIATALIAVHRSTHQLKSTTASTPIKLVQNVELLAQKGVTLDAIAGTKSLRTADGACGSRGTYSKYYYDPAGFLSVTNGTENNYTCTTYDLNSLKNFTTADGSTVNSDLHTNVNGTSTRVTSNSGTSQTTVTVTNQDGTVMSTTGNNITEKCFGLNNTVCTQLTVDENMITTCLLVPDNGYYRIATAADNTLSLTWYYSNDTGHTNPYPCSTAPDFHVQFYNK